VTNPPTSRVKETEAMRDPRYLCIEAPDTSVTIDFLTGAFKCTAKLEVSTNRHGEPEIYVKVTGCDDRATILIDQVAVIPEPDDRS
jgi:hypothetical protein